MYRIDFALIAIRELRRLKYDRLFARANQSREIQGLVHLDTAITELLKARECFEIERDEKLPAPMALLDRLMRMEREELMKL